MNDKNREIEELADFIFRHIKAMALCRGLASLLHKESYRKQSDVAEEIFAEIENILDRHSISYLKVGRICGEHYYDGAMQFDIAELKKKYTEEEK